MASTFVAFSAVADFSENVTAHSPVKKDAETERQEEAPNNPDIPTPVHKNRAEPKSEHGTRLVYDINIHLPATRDPAVYDALFASMRKHLDL